MSLTRIVFPLALAMMVGSGAAAFNQAAANKVRRHNRQRKDLQEGNAGINTISLICCLLSLLML